MILFQSSGFIRPIIGTLFLRSHWSFYFSFHSFQKIFRFPILAKGKQHFHSHIACEPLVFYFKSTILILYYKIRIIFHVFFSLIFFSREIVLFSIAFSRFYSLVSKFKFALASHFNRNAGL